MRFSMIGILISRELRRLRKNPSALMLIGLLTAIALMMATSRPLHEKKAAPSVRSVWIITDETTPWLEHLEKHLPASPVVRIVDRQTVERTHPRFLPNEGLLEIRHEKTGNRVRILLNGKYPGPDPRVMDTFWEWFWPQLLEFQHKGVEFQHLQSPLNGNGRSFEQQSVSELMTPELVGTMLLLIVQFFSCCHLLVSCTSQDRERGTLTALVLSPASISEIMAAKFLFHLTLSLGSSALIVGILKPAVLFNPVFWSAALLTSIGLMCVGLCISTMTKSQAAAGLLALSYMLGGAVLFYLSSRYSGFRLLRTLSFESYSFPLFFNTLKHPDAVFLAPGLTMMVLLIGVWLITARQCFARFGWR